MPAVAPAANGGAAGLSNSSHLGDGSESEAAAGNGGGGAASDLWASLTFGRGSGGGDTPGRGGARSALHKLFSRGNDVEAAGVNHKVGADVLGEWMRQEWDGVRQWV